MLNQLRLWGAPADVLAATEVRLKAEASQATVAVWPENWHAVLVFRAMHTAWHWVSLPTGARRAGLRYESLHTILPAVRRMVARQWRQRYSRLVQQLQHLEDEALAEIARRS